MANTINPPTGLGWDENCPAIDDVLGNSCFEIRDLRKGVRIRLEKEHSTISTSGAGGEHKQGSAISYAGDYTSAWPVLRPDGATSLSASDTGRMAINTASSPNKFAIYVHPSWIEIGEIIGDTLIVRGNTTNYSNPIALYINDDAAADPNNEFRFAITAANTLKLQGKNAADNGWNDIFTWTRGTLSMTAGSAIAMGGNKITGLAAGTTNGDAVRYEQVVLNSGDQTISGVKTFSSFPVLPSSAPTTNYQIANKKYVDDSIDDSISANKPRINTSETVVEQSASTATNTQSSKTFNVTAGKSYLILTSFSVSTHDDHPIVALYIDTTLLDCVHSGAHKNVNHDGKAGSLIGTYTASSTTTKTLYIKTSTTYVTLRSWKVVIIEI